MQKVFAAVLLIIMCVSNLISQTTGKPSPTPTPSPAAQNSTQQPAEAKLERKTKRIKRLKAKLAKLRKENQRLRAIIARQKKSQSRKSNRAAKAAVRKSVKGKRYRKTSAKRNLRPAVIVPTVVAATTLTDTQIEAIASQVYNKIKGEKITASISKEDMAALEKMIDDKIKASASNFGGTSENGTGNGEGTPPPAEDGVWATITSALGSAWNRVTENIWTIVIAVLVLALLIFAIRAWRRRNVRRSSLEETRFQRARTWVSSKFAGKPEESLSIKQDASEAFKPFNGDRKPSQVENDLYKDLAEEVRVEPIPHAEETPENAVNETSDLVEESEEEKQEREENKTVVTARSKTQMVTIQPEQPKKEVYDLTQNPAEANS